MSTPNEDPAPDIFPESRWTLVQRIQEGSGPSALEALNELCRIYWRPVYAYIRRRGWQPEEAEDLTQAYFASLLDREYLSAAAREKGKLRAFLLKDLNFFLSNEWRREQAACRGGKAIFVPVDTEWAEEHDTWDPVDTSPGPDAWFDRKWALALLASVLETVRAEYRAKGRESLFEALRPFLSWNAGAEPYAAVADRIGENENYVKQNVFRLRQAYKAALRDAVAQTVASPEEVDEEIRQLAAMIC